MMNPGELRKAVRERYSRTVLDSAGTVRSSGCCGSTASAEVRQENGQHACGSGCCGGQSDAGAIARTIGYSSEELDTVPEGSNLGLGCGNPRAIASLRTGETVLDLGSGAGFDCFLASRQVGENGRVIGVDMTPEMLERARRNAESGGYSNIEFRLGEIEHLPLADSSVDVIISNCVINLSPEKERVFREAFRVLRPGGRLAVSDIVAARPIPGVMRENLDLYAGCIAGAATVAEIEAMLGEAGFTAVRVEPKDGVNTADEWEGSTEPEDLIFSANITAVRP